MHYLGTFNYIAAIIMTLFGLYVMMVQQNLFRKIMGMVILQSGVILFFISLSTKAGAKIPIISKTIAKQGINADLFANPLPHALMLTAIVVGVSTLGVGLVLITSIYRSYNTIEEDQILLEIDTHS